MFLKRTFNFLNKHFYIILIFSTIAKYTNNRFYKYISWLVKIFVLANIIFGVAYISYFTVLEHSFHQGFTIYQDLIYNYINQIINFWNDLINMDIEDNLIKQVSNKHKHDLEVQMKAGIKEAMKEAIDEALDKIHEDELQYNSNALKNFAFVSGVLFLSYFIFALPGSDITPEALNQFNWFNQSLIQFKLNILSVFSNPTNPGAPGNTGAASTFVEVVSPVTSESSNSSIYFGQRTITPNTPIASTSQLPPLLTADACVQTRVAALTVSKMETTVNFLQDAMNQSEQKMILDHVDSVIKIITD
jgi:hypothetical protein